MATTTLNATFDGINDVDALNGGTRSFDGGFLGYYSMYESNPANDFVLNASLTGSNWTVAAFRVGAASNQTQLNLTDLDAGTGRRIDYLVLGMNSNVNLQSTRVNYMTGYDGDLHDVTLGSADVRSVDLSATLNLLQTGSGWVNSISTANRAVVQIGSGGAGQLTMGAGNDTVTTTSGYVGTIDAGKGNNSITTGSEYVGSIRANIGNDIVVIGSGGAGDINLNSGNNRVTTGSGFVEFISTKHGADVITIGSEGAGHIRTRDGNDKVTTGGGEVKSIHAGDGADIVSIGSGGAS